MPLLSYSDVRRACLARIEEETGANVSDWYDDVEESLIEAWRLLAVEHPWLPFVKAPPGVFVTQDDITARTVTIASAGTPVTATLDANPQSGQSMAGRKIRPTGFNWHARITAHVADSTSLTLDAAPETVAAGTACTIFQDEITLASDVGLFYTGGIWAATGEFIELWDEERLRTEHPDPPSGAWPPEAFCRLGSRLIRFSDYPNVARRGEYPYTFIPADPSGTGELEIPSWLRPTYLHGTLAIAYGFKNDPRQAGAATRYEQLKERAITYNDRLMVGLGRLDHGRAAAALYR